MRDKLFCSQFRLLNIAPRQAGPPYIYLTRHPDRCVGHPFWQYEYLFIQKRRSNRKITAIEQCTTRPDRCFRWTVNIKYFCSHERFEFLIKVFRVPPDNPTSFGKILRWARMDSDDPRCSQAIPDDPRQSRIADPDDPRWCPLIPGAPKWSSLLIPTFVWDDSVYRFFLIS